jgi:glycosyltransferase involved in cell wall biosynthesis
LHLPQDKRLLLTIARGIQTKRVDFLVRLLAHLPDTVLISLGEGEQYEGWRRYAEQQGVGDRFITPGRIQNADIAPYAKAADAFVLASHTENYPFAAIEMVLAGLPAFLSDRGGNREAGENFPSRVQVLPYEDERAWLAALNQPISAFEPVDTSVLPNMVDQYLDEVQRLIHPR